MDVYIKRTQRGRGIQMRNIFSKAVVFFTGILVSLGISISGTDANVLTDIDKESTPKDKVFVNEVTEQTPLYLNHADQIFYQDGDLLAQHYSHYSHSSHHSHHSHHSHYSSY